MAGNTLTFCLIVGAELIVLFRLILPDFLAFAEARYDDVYGVVQSDCRQSALLNDPFHDTPNTTEAQRDHA